MITQLPQKPKNLKTQLEDFHSPKEPKQKNQSFKPFKVEPEKL